MRKIIIALLIFLGIIGILLRYGYPILVERLGLQGRAGIKIDSNPKTSVYINGQKVAQTPFQDENLKEGEYLVELKVDEASSSAQGWKGYVGLNAGTLSVVNREIGESQVNSSGEVITLASGSGVTIISTPTEATVLVDGVERGRTPLSISSLPSGEHQFIISHDNFLNRSIRANLVDGYNLKLNVDLALSEADLTQISSPPITANVELTVKKTPTGFLNVRQSASINAKVVVQVKPGDKLVLLEELPNWNRVRTSDGKEGFVSSAYVEKKNP